jgi:hypothetical protein
MNHLGRFEGAHGNRGLYPLELLYMLELLDHARTASCQILD